MGIAGTALLLVVGVVCTFAIESDSAQGFNANTIGMVLMAVGALDLLVAALAAGGHDRAHGDRRPCGS